MILAANLLGTDPMDDDAKSKANDAVKEFMNIVCGQFITASHGTEDVFDLTIPQIRELPEPPDLAEDDGDRITTLLVEGHPLQLSHEPGEDGAPA